VPSRYVRIRSRLDLIRDSSLKAGITTESQGRSMRAVIIIGGQQT